MNLPTPKFVVYKSVTGAPMSTLHKVVAENGEMLWIQGPDGHNSIVHRDRLIEVDTEPLVPLTRGTVWENTTVSGPDRCVVQCVFRSLFEDKELFVTYSFWNDHSRRYATLSATDFRAAFPHFVRRIINA